LLARLPGGVDTSLSSRMPRATMKLPSAQQPSIDASTQHSAIPGVLSADFSQKSAFSRFMHKR
jgi:hypothetical protein